MVRLILKIPIPAKYQLNSGVGALTTTKTELALRNLCWSLYKKIKGTLQAKRRVQLKQHRFPENHKIPIFSWTDNKKPVNNHNGKMAVS